MTHTYAANNPKGWMGDPKRGAALGRRDRAGDPNHAGKLTLTRVRLDSDGYDGLGTYWGIGKPLFWFASEDGSIDRVVRADNRELARLHVLSIYPHAKVRR